MRSSLFNQYIQQEVWGEEYDSFNESGNAGCKYIVMASGIFPAGVDDAVLDVYFISGGRGLVLDCAFCHSSDSKADKGGGIASILALGIGALITNAALKNMFARTRPYEVIDGLILLVERQSDFSFPSGHSCASFAAATVCYKMFPKKYGVPALGLAALIAFSRLYVGVHYPSDVIAGTLIGILAAMAAYKIVEKISEKKKNKSNHRTGT